VDEDDLDDYLLEVAVEIIDEADEIVANDIEIDDFVGSFLVASKDDELVLLAFMLDEHSETNYIAKISFEDGLEDEVIEILESFYAFD